MTNDMETIDVAGGDGVERRGVAGADVDGADRRRMGMGARMNGPRAGSGSAGNGPRAAGRTGRVTGEAPAGKKMEPVRAYPADDREVALTQQTVARLRDFQVWATIGGTFTRSQAENP